MKNLDWQVMALILVLGLNLSLVFWNLAEYFSQKADWFKEKARLTKAERCVLIHSITQRWTPEKFSAATKEGWDIKS